MAETLNKRMAVDVEGDFVVFLIGMRINKPWKIHKWWPVFTAMPRMLRELQKNPQLGFLGGRGVFGSPLSPMVIQYWRSFEHLEAYARSNDGAHFPAWVKFNKNVRSNGDVGIWHETYKVAAGQYEAVYNNVPPIGLGAVGQLVPAAGYRSTARGRVEQREANEVITPEGELVS